MNIRRIFSLPSDTIVVHCESGEDYTVATIIKMNEGTDPRDNAWMDCFMTTQEMENHIIAGSLPENLWPAAKRHIKIYVDTLTGLDVPEEMMLRTLATKKTEEDAKVFKERVISLDKFKEIVEASYDSSNDIFHLEPLIFDAAERHGFI